MCSDSREAITRIFFNIIERLSVVIIENEKSVEIPLHMRLPFLVIGRYVRPQGDNGRDNDPCALTSVAIRENGYERTGKRK